MNLGLETGQSKNCGRKCSSRISELLDDAQVKQTDIVAIVNNIFLSYTSGTYSVATGTAAGIFCNENINIGRIKRGKNEEKE